MAGSEAFTVDKVPPYLLVHELDETQLKGEH